MLLVEIRLYATLRQYAPSNAVAGVFSTDIPEKTAINELLNLLNIPAAEVHIVMVNGTSVAWGHNLSSGDRVGLFPAIGGG